MPSEAERTGPAARDSYRTAAGRTTSVSQQRYLHARADRLVTP
jgi:hypothetical protein